VEINTTFEEEMGRIQYDVNELKMKSDELTDFEEN
jgi:hypothetical protein